MKAVICTFNQEEVLVGTFSVVKLKLCEGLFPALALGHSLGMGDSDSENEGSQTNVSRLVIRPPGHTGKAQKGHLAFEATYESANLGRVDFVSDTEYDVYIRPDTCNPRHR